MGGRHSSDVIYGSEKVTFPVTDVKKSTKPWIKSNQIELKEKLGRDPESFAVSSNGNVGDLIFSGQGNSLETALHVAFNSHYPLVLSPDMIWLCIIQGLSFHINANAEQLRKHFVSHEGKATISVRRDDFVKGSQNPWEEVFPEFTGQIKDYIGSESHDCILPKFSTTGPVEKAVCEIVLMESMKSYFDFVVQTSCGIPEITLEGTTSDWQLIRNNAAKLAKYDLEWWIPHLLPVLDQFVAASSGNVNKKFWSDLYKLNSASGGPYVSGWILKLFPYIGANGTERNRWLKKSVDLGCFGGLTSDTFPSGLSKAPFVWHYLDQEFNMSFVGGFMAVTQDPETLYLRPQLGWAVVDEDQKEYSMSHRF